MSFYFVQTRVDIALVGSVWPDADALLLPANDYLWMAGGCALDVKRSAGDDVEVAAVRLGPLALGEVAVTEAGALPLRGILHAAVMGQDLHPVGEAANRAMRRSLQIASERHWKRLLVHSFRGMAQRGAPDVVHSVAEALIDTLLDGSSLEQVTFLAVDKAEQSILHAALLRTIQKRG